MDKNRESHTKPPNVHGPRFLLAFGLMLAVGGCAEIIPRFELRDDYMFKRFLQPDRVVGEIRRDEFGNPILKQPVVD